MNRNTGRGGNQNSQRRPAPRSTNFVPGGMAYPRQPIPSQSQGTPIKQASAPTQKAPIQQTPKAPAQQTPKAPLQQTPKAPSPQTPKAASPQTPKEQKPLVQKMETQDIEQSPKVDGGNKDSIAEKPSWMKNSKIPKKERSRRRNMRLSKLLQPKNALMILNELVKNPVFEVSEVDGQFQAVLLVAGTNHVGLGKSKSAARNAASEEAIKHLIKHKNVGQMMDMLNDSSETMDTDEANESTEEALLPWQQVASFAIYKLFDSWGESCNMIKVEDQPKKVNSARKMPENPETVNPMMMIHQMYPNAVFDELDAVGNPPNITFTLHLKIEDQVFEGIGPSKKAAKKQACLAACQKLLGIVYPAQQTTPQ